MPTETSADTYRDHARITSNYGHAHYLPGPYATLEDMRIAHRASCGHYFDAETNRFFGARYHSDAIAGRMFIDSTRCPDGTREYRLNAVGDVRGTVSVGRVILPGEDPAGDGARFATLGEARKAARDLCAALGVSVHRHDTCPPTIARAFIIGEMLEGTGVWDDSPPTSLESIRGRYTNGYARYGTRTLRPQLGDEPAYLSIIIGEDSQRVELRCAGLTLSAQYPYAAGAYDVFDRACRLLGDLHCTPTTENGE